MSDSTKTDNVQAVAAALPSRVFKPGALVVIVAFLTGGVGAVGGLAFAQSSVKGTVDAGVGPLAEKFDQHVRAEALAREQLQLEVAELKRQQQAEASLNARRFEVTINTILEKRLQPETAELAAPAKDGGR